MQLLGTEGPLHLAGYGVELAIKNMEYSALDDSQVPSSSCPCLSHPLWLLLAFIYPTCPLPALPPAPPSLPILSDH